MSHRWTLYGLDKLIDIEQLDLPELEEQLDDVVICTYNDTIDRTGHEINQQPTQNREIDETFNSIKLEGTDWQVLIVVPNVDIQDNSTRCSVMSGNFNKEDIQTQFFKYFKDIFGVVVWPLMFDIDSMVSILDSVVNKTRWYDTVVYFENSRQNKNDSDDERRLAQWTINISRYDCETLVGTHSDGKPYRRVIFPYIETQTGFSLSQLPIKFISLRNLLRISRNGIRTVRPSMESSILISQLPYISKLIKK
ncbi:similar to Saccharomyces cerevisiae YBR107C IML3 Protein with a role in kinetochore function [Maudiozyma barnettii]|uniref:Similar to Saccharomyces cerevisiae YBR107C IML3 Protein with a role in kinetochore function n=1 Tax=Maudiozyma barnettii TaxID=61262 RepID=A0A8H2ZHA2_9SACH|nr:uncharacterized protein KABA2_01S02178 [Kazachstania barnettii]CAB4251934.1 similar to Saccharomyces cerevisiae YBR107C IML3 Protein with a role in kinetochore function [Kazachstania barnettii]CAD1778289.1 similar to Saccharomyces cerevisiae YBR107C IML3 Protein with a role in kinetochore function [Kazachstania barnettii]